MTVNGIVVEAAIVTDLRRQLAEMTNRLLTIQEMAERAEWKEYSLRPEDVLAVLRTN